MDYSKLKKENWELVREYREYLEGQDKYSKNWIERAVLKFTNGRVEHHNDINEINCDFEIEQEEMDIEAYSFIKSRQDL